MREILFRGKAVKSGEWHYGMFCAEGYDTDFPCIIPSDSDRMHIASGDWHVDLETIGQFTGLCDKNGTKIFEGDIVESRYNSSSEIYLEEIVFQDCSYYAKKIGTKHLTSLIEELFRNSIVIGNIYDNPELLKGGAE